MIVSRKKPRKFTAFFSVIMLALMILSVGVNAAALKDPEHQASLTVGCCYNDHPIKGVAFSLYKIADSDEDGNLTITQEFVEYNIDLDQNDSSGWRALALTLDAYVQRDNIDPCSSALTDADGNAYFFELSLGMYLVHGDFYSSQALTYTPEPFLITLPQLGTDGEWCYDVYTNCKGEGSENEPELIDLSVLKVWEDSGTTAVRPESIAVQLLCDGEIFDTVILNAENGWYYVWHDLDSAHMWQVAEENIPEGYTLLVSRDGWAFVLTNTGEHRITELCAVKVWVDDGNEDKRPQSINVQLLCDGVVVDIVTLNEENGWSHRWTQLGEEHTWTVREESVPAGYYCEITEEGITFYVVNTYKPIAQTGQLWWPVPALACMGIVCIFTAIIRRRTLLS